MTTAQRYSNVAEREITVHIPEGPLSAAVGVMAADLYRKALEAGFDLFEPIRDTRNARGCVGSPGARYEGIRDGMAVYTCYRQTGRGESC